ncbi:putative glutathione-specific gamma-glutamylcyclotransferase 2 [Antedon mediterranea]|uniref:putative glutathione-specific gamma-glutamylcyclotransferase 2 n=1 Tax=Antedon mediterranea TaxID=105859 RepID=UPI003AF57A49
MWVFGYGSLTWKVDFSYEEKMIGYIEGFSRRFWQGSPDHRGTPRQPGRVVTLVKNPEELVWGIAYKLSEESREETITNLDHREKAGYSSIEVLFQPQDSATKPFTINLYIANEQNPHYLGPAPEEDIAKQVIESHGPSGPNSEYLLQLATAMRVIVPEHKDEHLYKLESLVKDMLQQG